MFVLMHSVQALFYDPAREAVGRGEAAPRAATPAQLQDCLPAWPHCADKAFPTLPAVLDSTAATTLAHKHTNAYEDTHKPAKCATARAGTQASSSNLCYPDQCLCSAQPRHRGQEKKDVAGVRGCGASSQVIDRAPLPQACCLLLPNSQLHYNVNAWLQPALRPQQPPAARQLCCPCGGCCYCCCCLQQLMWRGCPVARKCRSLHEGARLLAAHAATPAQLKVQVAHVTTAACAILLRRLLLLLVRHVAPATYAILLRLLLLLQRPARQQKPETHTHRGIRGMGGSRACGAWLDGC